MRQIIPSRPTAFTGGRLDRAAHKRLDDAWIAAALQDRRSKFSLYWRGQTLLGGGPMPSAALLPRPETEAPWVFLGLQDDVPIFALDISALDDPHAILPLQGGNFDNLRGMQDLPADDAAILVTARGMLHWRATHRHCPRCGGATAPVRAGYVLQCTQCGTEHFPRTDPAVIMLATRGEYALLGQSHNFPVEMNFYSTLAGFVEPGEGLEDAVRREVLEEVGVRVGAVSYYSSQPWPFPASLMLGFYAEALSEEIVLEAAEMRDAKWVTRDEIRNREALGFNIPPPTSIARRLIDDWVAQSGEQAL